jgi:membrane dipeptidase
VTAEEARRTALTQLNWYRQQIDEGRINFVTSARDLPSPDEDKPIGPQRAILLMEGADALRSPQDVPEWFDYGLRIVGLAWRRTRMAGGTGEPGPLTDEGRALVRAFDQAGIIHDISHLADESFWQLMDLATGPVMASHSNARALVPSDRQISDEMIRAIAARDGVIGLNLYDEFLMPPDQYRKRPCRMDDLLAHFKHLANLLGSTKHLALGTDLDGGVGQEQIPQEIKSIAELHKIADALSACGFADEDVRGIMGQNWLRFFRRALPQ